MTVTPIKLAFPIRGRLILSANLLWVFLVNLCSAAVCVRLPIAFAWPWILAACIGVIGYLVVALKPVKVSYATPGAFAISVGAVFWALSPYLFPARFLSVYLDAWSYCAFAEYITRFSAGVHGGLAPIYQWASHLSGTRYSTSSILAFLGGITRLGPLGALPYYSALVLVNIFWGVCLLARTFGCSSWMSVAAGAFSVLYGLIPDVMIAANFDNLLFLSILPCLVVRVRLHRCSTDRFASSVGLAFNLAAGVYAYPEGALIAGFILLPTFLTLCLRSFRRSRWLARLCTVAALTLLLLSPYLVILIKFLQGQLYAGMTAASGSEMFPGFFLGGLLPSLLGTGTEWVGAPPSWLDFGFATVCIFFMAAALPRLAWRRPDLVASLILLLLLGFWQGYLVRYPYGLFKVLNVGAILTNALLFLGVQEICRQFSGAPAGLLAIMIAMAVIAWGAGERRQNTGDLPIVATPKVKTYAELRQVPQVVGGSPILISMDNAFDQAWTIYFLGDAPFVVDRYLGYLGQPLLRDLMNGAKRITSFPNHVLSNFSGSNPIWRSGNFCLSMRSKIDPPMLLDSPNGVESESESVTGGPLIWIGNRPVTFLVKAREACEATFQCAHTMLGPSLPDVNKRLIGIRNGDFFQRVEVQNRLSVRIPLHQGDNKLEIWDEDLPALPKFSDRDPRVLLFGIRDYGIEPVERSEF